MTQVDPTRRSLVRRALRQAAAGDRLSYLRLANESLDLVTETFAVAGVTGSAELASSAASLFARLWPYVGLMRRVSDWERMLCMSLETIQPTLAFTLPDPVAARMRPLSSLSRFCLVAMEMEGWSLARLSLAQRRSPEFLIRHLGRSRSELGGFDRENLQGELQPAFDRLNRTFCPHATDRQKRRVDRIVAKHAQLREFKSLWLEARCELIELRQRVRLSGGDRHPFGKTLADCIALEKPVAPLLRDRLRLWIKFDPPISFQHVDS